MFYHAKYIKDVVAAFGYSTSSIFDIAGKYHVIALFNYNNFIEKAVSASFIYRHGIVWITAYAYVLLYILINNLAVKKKIEIIQILVPFIAVWIFWNLPVKYFSGYYHGVSIKGMLLQLIFPSCVYLWYLECLFFVFVIASFVCKLETKKQIVIVSFCWCIGVRQNVGSGL